MIIQKEDERSPSELVVNKLFEPEPPGALSARLRAVYEPWLDGASIDRGARMQDATVETDEDDE